MKKVITMFSIVAMFAAVGCSEKKETKVEIESEEMMDDMEDAMDDAGDAMEDAGDEMEDELDS